MRMSSACGLCVWSWREERGVIAGGVTAISTQLGINRETLRRWVIEQEVETGGRPGVTRAERSRTAELERENRELRRPMRS
jgi:transposase-like protein